MFVEVIYFMILYNRTITVVPHMIVGTSRSQIHISLFCGSFILQCAVYTLLCALCRPMYCL